MSDHDDQDRQLATVEPVTRKFYDSDEVAGPAPLFTEHVEHGKRRAVTTISKQINLLPHEHESLRRCAKRHGKDMHRMLKDAMMRGLRLQEELDRGKEVAVLGRGGRIEYKVL